ncbi:MAG: hypothetical protein QOG69_1302, partial [Actinomycetota bacterium]|nr:hypothetical protein [Actinomycetota bacterium]
NEHASRVVLPSDSSLLDLWVQRLRVLLFA